jgi:hypothetical protein
MFDIAYIKDIFQVEYLLILYLPIQSGINKRVAGQRHCHLRMSHKRLDQMSHKISFFFDFDGVFIYSERVRSFPQTKEQKAAIDGKLHR